MPTLSAVLSDLLAGRVATAKLGRGLMLQFHKAENAADTSRLLCYRINQPPSPTEADTVMKNLLPLLPTGTGVKKHKQKSYPGADGLPRVGVVLEWASAPPVQASLLDVPQMSLYTEAE